MTRAEKHVALAQALANGLQAALRVYLDKPDPVFVRLVKAYMSAAHTDCELARIAQTKTNG